MGPNSADLTTDWWRHKKYGKVKPNNKFEFVEVFMIKFCNYLDIPSEKKDAVLEQLLQLGFRPAYGKLKTIKKEMDKSQAGTLPQYLFVFRDDRLIGYMFLIAEKEHSCKAFPWWAVDNSDELPLEISIQLLELGIALSAKYHFPILSNRLTLQLENQKKGIGRRPETLCR